MLALGNVAFAYSYSFILIEVCVRALQSAACYFSCMCPCLPSVPVPHTKLAHSCAHCTACTGLLLILPALHACSSRSISPFPVSQDTIRAPNEAKTLKRASWISILVTTAFYMSIGTIGYAAFGDDCPGNLLTGFGFYEPYWLVIIANLAIVIHLIGGYQVWTQPFLMAVESKLESLFPNSAILKAGFNMPAGRNKVWHVRYYILVWRSIYVVFTTIIAILAPFFNDIVGAFSAQALRIRVTATRSADSGVDQKLHACADCWCLSQQAEVCACEIWP